MKMFLFIGYFRKKAQVAVQEVVDDLIFANNN